MFSETERELEEAFAIRRELETLEGDKSAKVKMLEKSNKLMKQEKEDTHHVSALYKFYEYIVLTTIP